MKELSRAITASIPFETVPLPEDLLEIIQAYLDKHSPIEDSDSQRLQEELISIYQRDVEENPKRYPRFVAILRQLRPAISTSSRVLQWWETLVVPILDHLTEQKGLAAETRGILLDILAYDTDDGDEAALTSAVLSEKILEIWLRKNISSVEAAPKERFLEEQIQQV
jgi:solute carrier family 25 protein 16